MKKGKRNKSDVLHLLGVETEYKSKTEQASFAEQCMIRIDNTACEIIKFHSPQRFGLYGAYIIFEQQPHVFLAVINQKKDVVFFDIFTSIGEAKKAFTAYMADNSKTVTNTWRYMTNPKDGLVESILEAGFSSFDTPGVPFSGSFPDEDEEAENAH